MTESEEVMPQRRKRCRQIPAYKQQVDVHVRKKLIEKFSSILHYNVIIALILLYINDLVYDVRCFETSY
jgi:hypothetical protein